MTEKQRSQTAQRQQRFRERQALSRRAEQESKGLPPLPTLPTVAGQARWQAALVSAHLLVQQVHDEMQTYYEERSETWQEGEAGERFVERQESVETLLDQFAELLL